MWLYVNIRNNSQVPAAFSFFMLGSTIAVFMALLFNIFSKISLHTIGMGGLLAGMLIIITNWSYGWIDVEIPLLGTGIVLSDRFVILICILLAGITGSCRLYLGAHRQDEIYGGYLLGIFAQMAGFIIYF
jgi:membrane-associated phospholipid phosphatase